MPAQHAAQHAATFRSRITRKHIAGGAIAIVVLLIAAAGIAGSASKAGDALRGDLEAANAQVARLQDATADLEAQVTDLKTEVSTLKDRIARLRAAVPLPDFAGTILKETRGGIEARGWTVKVTRVESSQPVGTVLSQQPSSGTVMKLGGLVTLTVAKAPAPPPPAPAPVISTGNPGVAPGGGCHPSYTGACLDPNASDYDCAGGTGDGPYSTGPVRVVGYDEFGLDTDNDGYGCE